MSGSMGSAIADKIAKQRLNVIMLVDCSSSMRGERIAPGERGDPGYKKVSHGNAKRKYQRRFLYHSNHLFHRRVFSESR